MESRTNEVISFGPFRLFPFEHVLKKADEPIKLGARAFDILLVLIERTGEVVSNKELMERVWPGIFVEEVSLRVQVAALRKALGADETGAAYLTNVPGRGYCFVAASSRETINAASAPMDTFEAAYSLPPPLARMIGRDDTVREVSQRVLQERFVTIVAPGGMGKTTVALSVAHSLLNEFRGAVCFVELGPLADPKLVAETMASAFGLPVQSLDPIPSLVAHLRSKRVLLVLDNSEHLADSVANVTSRLFDEAPNLHVLVTSRETLRIEAETVYRLPPLEGPPENAGLTADYVLTFPAVKLFTERAAAGGKPIMLDDEEAPIVAGVCRKLDGIALAIELAAGRVGVFGLRQTAAMLDTQFALRWPGRRTAPQRHQTLNAMLDWSYNLLSDAEQRILRRLSVFAGGFTLQGAQEVAGDPDLSEAKVFDAVASLVAKSLASPDSSGSVTRYRLLDTTRTYAALKLDESGERALICRRHAIHLRNLLQSVANQSESSPSIDALKEIDNVRAALGWALAPGGDKAIGVDLSALSVPVWFGKALLTECRDWMLKAAAASENDAPSPQRLAIQIALASSVILSVGLSEDFRSEWTVALQLALHLDDIPGQLTACLALWGQAIRTPSYSEALKWAEKCAAVASTVSDPGPSAMAEWMLGVAAHHSGRFADARVHLRRAIDTDTEAARLTQLRRIGYDRRIATLGVMAHGLWAQGFPDQAKRMGLRAIDEARHLPFALPLGVAMTWAGLNTYLSEMDIDVIEGDIVELVEHARTHAIASDEGVGLCLLGLCQARREQLDTALHLTDEGLRLCAEASYGVFAPFVLAQLIEAMRFAGRGNEAKSLMVRLEGLEPKEDYWSRSETIRVKGLLADKEADAEALFSEAIKIARKQGALAWELRATTSLSRTLAKGGRRSEAIDALEPIFKRFTEGFYSVDLIAARQLLDELRPSSSH